jgi:hypothetical protein
MSTADNLQKAQSEDSRLGVELAAVESAGHDPILIGRLRIEKEMSARRLADVFAADAVAQAAQRARDADVLLDTVAPSVDAAAAEVWDKWETFRIAATELHDAYRQQTATVAYLIGAVTSTVHPSATDRYSQGPAGVVVDRKTLRNTPELSANVMAAVAPLVAIGNPSLADRLRTASGTATKLVRPTPTAQQKAS